MASYVTNAVQLTMCVTFSGEVDAMLQIPDDPEKEYRPTLKPGKLVVILIITNYIYMLYTEKKVCSR